MIFLLNYDLAVKFKLRLIYLIIFLKFVLSIILNFPFFSRIHLFKDFLVHILQRHSLNKVVCIYMINQNRTYLCCLNDYYW